MTLPEVVVSVQVAVDQLRGFCTREHDPEVALACAGVLLVAEQALARARLRALADVEDRQLHRLTGARSMSAWLTGQGAEVAPAQVLLSRRLASLPLLAEELATGRLSAAVCQRVQVALSRLRPHVDRPDGLIDGQDAEQALAGVIGDGVPQLVCEAHGGVGDDELCALRDELRLVLATPTGQLARLEAAFVILAAHVEPGQLGPALDVLVDSLLPAQLEDRHRRGELARAVSLVKMADGSRWRLSGELSLEAGERAHAVLCAEMLRDPANPDDTARAGDLQAAGLDPHDAGLDLPESTRPRSRAERMHDALSSALGRYLGADLGGSHDKNPVHLLVTVPAATLDGVAGSVVARSASGSTLPASLVRRWACGSALTRLALSLTGRVLQVSHTGRTLTAAERRVLHARTRGSCQEAGCPGSSRTPGAVMHPHHATPWATTGTTSLADTVLLCDRTHGHLHRGHRITLRDGRRLGPDGWIE